MPGAEIISWYNPNLEDFEWGEVPESDEEALSLLEGSPYSPTCIETYREWRGLGSSIAAALIRAGEVGRDEAQPRWARASTERVGTPVCTTHSTRESCTDVRTLRAWVSREMIRTPYRT